jgi:uncharacterized protein (DUF2235 family)
MAKNIIICADGTGNTTIKGRGTNVFKTFEAIDTSEHRSITSLPQQVAIYHDGVGTESLKWIRLLSGASGWGLSRNVKQLYAELARVYIPGDRIFLFGFSRGAFTVRTLAGLIATCGILDVSKLKYNTNRAFRQGIRSAYKAYRQKYQTRISRLLRGTRTLEPDVLRKRFSVEIPGFTYPGEPVIQFIGVWDTVDAVGLPFRLADVINEFIWRFKFPDTTLSKHVGVAYHALSLDEARQSFAPVLWDEGAEDPSQPRRVEQVWFAGVHSNVGGGYPRQGMSLVALDWMMAKAEQHGVRFHSDQRRLYHGAADVNDKRYDSRAGFGVLYRWKPRNVEHLCQVCHHLTPKVHRSVFERISRGTEGYAPGAVPTSCEVISSTALPSVLASIAATVKIAFDGKPPLLQQARHLRAVGVAGYVLLIITVTMLGGLILRTYLNDSAAQTANWRGAVKELANTAVSSHWVNVILRTVWHYPWLAALAALSLILLLWADHRLDKFYSSFWHNVRPRLRQAS